MRKNYLFTSESVTEGHPDKICDQISDAVLDAILAQDKTARVACETTTTTGMIMVMGEISTSAKVDIEAIARKTVDEIGYNNIEYGFKCNSCEVIVRLDEQSCDIALGVDNSLEVKAGNDLKMHCGYPEELKKALDSGDLTRADLEVCTRRILEMFMKLA